MKKIKYTPDAADKLRALKATISQEYGVDNARKIVKNITDAIRGLSDYEEKGPEVSKMFDVVSDYRYIFKLKLLNVDVDSGIETVNNISNSLQKVLDVLTGKNIERSLIINILEIALDEKIEGV